MHLDLQDADRPEALQTEVCIIGAGAAGITAARRLLELGHGIVLLESGGLDYEPATAGLNAGANIGEPYYDLEDARLRFFGGTTAIWGGRVVELDPIDLETRAWVPHSGWPIGWSDLSPYYGPARRLFDLPEQPPDLAGLRGAGVRPPEFADARLQLSLWTFDRRFNRFVFDACQDLVEHPRATVVTHATATELELSADGRRVVRVAAKSLTGAALKVDAQAVVLATGGVENPRLLLASRSVAPQGLGNAHDQVGRYFMEHPHTRGGRILHGAAWRLLDAFGRTHLVDGQEIGALIRPSDALQAERGILNSSLTLRLRPPAGQEAFWGLRAYMRIKHSIGPNRRGRTFRRATKKAAKWVKRRTDPLRPWLMHRLGQRDLCLSIRAEQAPNPLSRVRLTDQTDPLGLPRVALDWRTSQLDVDSVRTLIEVVGAEFARLGLGRVEAADWLSEVEATWRADTVSAHPFGGYHHMGTTRMSASPRDGVTDAQGRVHGVPNLYVAGSSLFPTSGWANPTLTIVALALRSADHLSATLRRELAA
ncbi:GMC family oxidoreductase [Phenylobacterium sp. LjRoot219]|uniref:FAD-dependent oxidoreductase n=1 Tax=Phenylobacterium sp. LjRoot219 TaxID=3342283 RepID=UPI003ECF1BC0